MGFHSGPRANDVASRMNLYATNLTQTATGVQFSSGWASNTTAMASSPGITVCFWSNATSNSIVPIAESVICTDNASGYSDSTGNGFGVYFETRTNPNGMSGSGRWVQMTLTTTAAGGSLGRKIRMFGGLSGSLPSDGKFHFYSFTYDAANLHKYYLDGQQQATQLSTAYRGTGDFVQTTTNPTYIGRLHPAVGTLYYTKQLRSVAVYNRALAATEIAALYKEQLR